MRNCQRWKMPGESCQRNTCQGVQLFATPGNNSAMLNGHQKLLINVDLSATPASRVEPLSNSKWETPPKFLCIISPSKPPGQYSEEASNDQITLQQTSRYTPRNTRVLHPQPAYTQTTIQHSQWASETSVRFPRPVGTWGIWIRSRLISQVPNTCRNTRIWSYRRIYRHWGNGTVWNAQSITTRKWTW